VCAVSSCFNFARDVHSVLLSKQLKMQEIARNRGKVGFRREESESSLAHLISMNNAMDNAINMNNMEER
jgi:hypothetical protein